VPAAAEARVSRLLEAEPTGGASIPVLRGVEPDRAYWLVVVTDIELDRVATLRADGVRSVPTAVGPSSSLESDGDGER
jgi:hypothetical protein